MQQSLYEKNAGFRRIYEKHSGIVYSVAYSFMKNRADANDVVQDVFFKYYQNMEKLNDESRIRSWLITVTANTCKNNLRSGWFSRTFSSENSSDIPYEQDFGEKSDLFCAVMKLSEKERVPLHLFYYEGCSTAEIAELLSVKESTVRVRLMRGREKLKKILKEESV